MHPLWSQPDRDVEDLIPELAQENVSRVLDLGCGLGRHVVLMAKSGFETYGLDSSSFAVEHCLKWLGAERLDANVCCADMCPLDFPDGFFDFIISWNVIYHATRACMIEALAEMGRTLRLGGLLYLTLNSTRNRHFGKGSEVEPGTFHNPEKGDGEHLHHYSDEHDVRDLLSHWRIESLKESEECLAGKPYPGSWHWKILARILKEDAQSAHEAGRSR